MWSLGLGSNVLLPNLRSSLANSTCWISQFPPAWSAFFHYPAQHLSLQDNNHQQIEGTHLQTFSHVHRFVSWRDLDHDIIFNDAGEGQRLQKSLRGTPIRSMGHGHCFFRNTGVRSCFCPIHRHEVLPGWHTTYSMTFFYSFMIVTGEEFPIGCS